MMPKENSAHYHPRPSCYALISPCRDEAEFVRFAVDSVLEQTVRPSLWVFVNDGSTDGTGQILDELAAKHSLIQVVHRQDRGHRHVGSG